MKWLIERFSGIIFVLYTRHLYIHWYIYGYKITLVDHIIIQTTHDRWSRSACRRLVRPWHVLYSVRLFFVGITAIRKCKKYVMVPIIYITYMIYIYSWHFSIQYLQSPLISITHSFAKSEIFKSVYIVTILLSNRYKYFYLQKYFKRNYNIWLRFIY